VPFSTSLVDGHLEMNAEQGGLQFAFCVELNMQSCFLICRPDINHSGLLDDCCRPIDAESKQADKPGPNVAPGPVAGPGPTEEEASTPWRTPPKPSSTGPVAGPDPGPVSGPDPGPVSRPGPTKAPQRYEDTLQHKVEILIESAADEWVRTYSTQGWSIMTAHALHDPASIEVGKSHPGTHPLIMESVLNNALFQRYTHSSCT